MYTWRLGIVIGLLIISFIWMIWSWSGLFKALSAASERCQAAQQTILDEAELIAAGGKFPGAHVTDRWKKLLGGC
jgi:hypothetical protein